MSQIDIEGVGGGVSDHNDLTNVTANQHHTESHSHASHTSIGVNDHHNQSHVHLADSSGTVDHGSLSGLSDDDHIQYQKESEKSQASGYASLGSGALVPTAELGSGSADSTVFLRGDQTWANPIQNIGAHVYHNANQAITTATDTVLAFNSERYDTGNLHDNTTNNSRLTVSVAGIYQIFGNIEWEAQAVPVGVRAVYLRLNGTTLIAANNRLGEIITSRMVICTNYSLVAGDYIELVVRQGGGVNLNVKTAGNTSPEFGMSLVQQAGAASSLLDLYQTPFESLYQYASDLNFSESEFSANGFGSAASGSGTVLPAIFANGDSGFDIHTGTTSGGYASIYGNKNSPSPRILALSTTPTKLKWRSAPVNTNLVQRMELLGLGSSVTNDTNYAAAGNKLFVGFRVDVTGANAAISAVTKNGASETVTVTGVTQVLDAKNTFEIVATSASIQYWIDGNLVATHTTNIPTGTIGPIWSCRTKENVSKGTQLDWVKYSGPRS